MPGLIERLRGDVESVAWPALHSSRTAPLAALLLELERTQWLPPEQLRAHQLRQLGVLAAHHHEHTPAFRERLQQTKLRPEDLAQPAVLAGLPSLRRREVQSGGEAMMARRLPPEHGGTHLVQSSGSTGEPVRVRKTDAGQLFWLAMTLRYHDWHEPDFTGRFCASRALVGATSEEASWGSLFDQFGPSGPALQIDNGTDIAEQLDLIARFRPTSLLVYPSNLAAMLTLLEGRGETLPELERVRTIGETLPASLRAAAEQQLNAIVRDCYSSEEVGYIAIECTEGGLYHVMAETVLVEVVDAAGRQAREGEIGRVLVTDLHNYAMPLIRYAIGDYAEVGPPCPCGRGLPTLKRIAGRERNLVVLPDGSAHWPITGYKAFEAIAPIAQYQLVQIDLETVEVRLVPRAAVSPEQEAALAAHVQKSLGHPFRIRFRYFPARIPPAPSGKFEEFVRLF